MPFFGSTWNDDLYDDSPLAMSSSMKEDIKEMYEKENVERYIFSEGAKNTEQANTLLLTGGSMIERLAKILNEVKTDIDKDCGYCDLPEIVDTPKGNRQVYDGDNSIFDHIYVDQKVGCLGDDYYGHIYYPVDGKYLKVGFSC